MFNLPSDYAAALTAAVFYPIPAPGYARVTGADRFDFLNRQTSNDLRLLTPGRSLVTVLTTPLARIQDVLILVTESADAIAAITLPGQGASTAAHFRGKIFFMDKVRVADASAEIAQFDLIGPRTGKILADLGAAEAAAAVAEGAEMLATLAGLPVRVVGLGAWGARLLVPAGESAACSAALTAAGAALLGASSYETLRIEAGRPAGGHECSEDYTPLESGLRYAISDRKGCYTGQEIIARQITYDKVTRQLAGVRAAEALQVGDVVRVEGKSVGEITSAALSPRFGPLALAILKRPWHEPGGQVEVGAAAVPAVVHTLPFS